MDLFFFGFVCYQEAKIAKSIPKYYLGDYDGMRNHLFQQLNKANLMDDTEKDWEYILDCIMDSCNKFIPKSKPGTKKRQNWVDKDFIRSVQLKRRAWNRFRKNKSVKNCTITLRQEIMLLGKPSKLREPTKKVLPRISKPILNVSGIWLEKKPRLNKEYQIW